MRPALLILFLFSTSVLGARDRVGTIDFFGYKGIDTAAIQRALPFHVGDPYVPQKTEAQARQTVLRFTGKAATEVGAVCCDDGDYHIFIGVAGASSKPLALNPQPRGVMRLAPELVDLRTRLDDAIYAAVRAGRAQEDDSQGYSLTINDPSSRTLQLKVRDYALAHEKELYAVLQGSSDAQHRQWAADAVGYGRQSAEQIAALLAAGRDPHESVRNEAVRALGCLANKPDLARLIAPDLFLELLNSGTWSDRNKSSWVLFSLTAAPDQKLLARLRAEALDPIIEMARWTSRGHASMGVMLFARIAGVPPEDANKASLGPVAGMLELLRPR